MAKRTGPTNPHLGQLIENLKKKSLELNAPIWKAIAKKLEKPTRQRIAVDLSRIERYTTNGETVIIPGIVLSSGQLTKTVNIAAWRFSDSAARKIKETRGKCLTIEELTKENPKGSNVKIIS